MSFPNEWIRDGGTLNSRGMKTGFGVQSRPDHAETPRSCSQFKLKRKMCTVTGQIMYLNCDSEYAIPPPMMIVQIHPPIKPSTVFLGDRRIRGVRPQSMPQMYANISFVMTRQTGKKNQINPSKIELTIKCAWNTTSKSVICVQQN